MMSLEDHIERILWTEQQISERVSELASQISDYFKGSSSSIVVVGVATGAFLFLADIVRKIKLPVSVDLLRVESYGSATESNGAPRISSDVKIDIKGKHVLLVEDIVDTGNTLTCVVSHLASKGASSVSVCSFLDKPARRKVHIELVGEGKFYRGFEDKQTVEWVNRTVPFFQCSDCSPHSEVPFSKLESNWAVGLFYFLIYNYFFFFSWNLRLFGQNRIDRLFISLLPVLS